MDSKKITEFLVKLINDFIDGTGSIRRTFFAYLSFITIIVLLFPDPSKLYSLKAIVEIVVLIISSGLFIYTIISKSRLKLTVIKEREIALSPRLPAKIIYKESTFQRYQFVVNIGLGDYPEFGFRLDSKNKLIIFIVGFRLGSNEGMVSIDFGGMGDGATIPNYERFDKTKDINIEIICGSGILTIRISQEGVKFFETATLVPPETKGDFSVWSKGEGQYIVRLKNNIIEKLK